MFSFVSSSIQAPKKEKAPPPSSNPVRSGGRKQKKKKWRKGKQKEKSEQHSPLRHASYEKMIAEVPKYKQITPSVLTERVRVLNEVDKLLNQEFEKSIDEILKALSLDRRTYLFSATVTKKELDHAKQLEAKNLC